MRLRIAVFMVAVAGLPFGLLPVDPAAATGAGAANVEFTVSGVLPTFPCERQCSTSFAGTGSGGGHATVLNGSTVYDATFTVLNGNVSGGATYTEPGIPFCPALGSASAPTVGQVTMTEGSGVATGVVYRSSSPSLFGTVTDVTFALSFNYIRVGATPVITITGGHVLVHYFFPDTGAGSFVSPVVVGVGTGAFVVLDQGVVLNCLLGAGRVSYTVAGDVDFVLS